MPTVDQYLRKIARSQPEKLIVSDEMEDLEEASEPDEMDKEEKDVE